MPHISPEKCNLNIVGLWNIGIFSPQWINSEFKDLFPGVEFNLNVAISNNTNLTYTTESVLINVSTNRLILGVKKISPENLKIVQSTAERICKKLEHTPIKGIGHNVLVELERDEKIISELDPTYKENEIAVFSNNLKSGTLNRKENHYSISFENYELNLATKYTKQLKSFDFNWHYDVKEQSNKLGIIAEFSSKVNESLELSKSLIKK